MADFIVEKLFDTMAEGLADKQIVDTEVEVIEEAKLVDNLIQLEKQQDRIDKHIARLESKLQEIGQGKLENSKRKQAVIYGSNGNHVEVTNAETPKLQFAEVVKAVFGEKLTPEVLSPKEGYDMTSAFKKIIAPICNKEYMVESPESVLRQIGIDDKKAKKIKGQFEKDEKFLLSLGISPKEAEENAYMIAEAYAFERFDGLMNVAGYIKGTPQYEQAVSKLRSAVIVETSVKIKPVYKDDE